MTRPSVPQVSEEGTFSYHKIFRAIARKINIAEATVKVHVKAILRKIRVNNRTQAAVWAMNNGLFDVVIRDSDPLPLQIRTNVNLVG